MADHRLADIYEAATQLFMEQGYKNTQVGEIAKRAGVATGTMYNLFAGKKAILFFVFRVVIDQAWLAEDISVPIQELDEARLAGYFADMLERYRGVLTVVDKEGNIVMPFQEMLEELFDFISAYQRVFNIIERNYGALKNIADQYFTQRRELFHLIGENLEAYMEAGIIRELTHIPVHVSNVMEGIAGWAMHLDDYPDIEVSQQEAKEIAVDLLVRAYRNEVEL